MMSYKTVFYLRLNGTESIYEQAKSLHVNKTDYMIVLIQLVPTIGDPLFFINVVHC